MANSGRLEEDSIYFARLAVEYDKQTKYDQAKFYYMEAAQALLSAKLGGSPNPSLTEKANEYILRCEQLNKLIGNAHQQKQNTKTELQMSMDRADFIIRQALDADEQGDEEEATSLYMEAAERCLNLLKTGVDDTTKEKLGKLAKQAIKRAEELKQIDMQPRATTGSRQPNYRPLGDALRDDEPSHHRRTVSQRSGGYTKEELGVLRKFFEVTMKFIPPVSNLILARIHLVKNLEQDDLVSNFCGTKVGGTKTSVINGRSYVPFLSVDINERFAFPLPFSDKDGKLALSAKQRQFLKGWVRPSEYIAEPQMIMAVSSFSVKQTVVSDCSFVASLAISAQYERRFHRQLITSIIYPQTKNGKPVYNPCGKYMVKLHINGVPRKVVIDDYLPMGVDGQLLCSFSSNRNELWVSILEKAYMKVMGGYDFPGSNSNIDLHALTGWIPERVAIKSSAMKFDKDKEFRKIQDKFHKGDCVVTVATGALPEQEAERAGLVVSHAYAMLDIREELGTRLLMLKNPWSHLRWKGRYSETDIGSWTPQLQKILNYDPKIAQQMDNGVFWIDYDSFCHFFECIYINWRPDLFAHTTCYHHTWTNKDGPVKDMYNISDNPQYRLELKNPGNSPAAVWILLTRHITDKADFADNKEFITVFVYKGGSRIFYPYDPAPYKDGVKINSPHYLCKMVEVGSQAYTLVLSQYEKTNTIHYTLRVYSQCPFTFNKIADPYNHEKNVIAEWKGKTAGGCGNFPETNKFNPIYQVTLDNSSATNQLLVELFAPREYSAGIEIKTVKANAPSAPGNQKELSSGAYRKGYCVVCVENLSGGVYNVIPSTFQPRQEGPFKIKFSSSLPISVSRLQ